MIPSEDETVFPFRDIDDNEIEFVNCSNELNVGDSIHQLYSKYENLNLKTFEHTDHKMHDFADIDPESNFFNGISNTCEYYNDEQFTNLKKEDAFSIIHFNSRSLYRHKKN